MNDERSRRKVRVDLQELRFAMEDATYEHQYFLDTQTGEVSLVSEIFDDAEAQRQLVCRTGENEQPFRSKTNIDFGPRRTPISEEAEH